MSTQILCSRERHQLYCRNYRRRRFGTERYYPARLRGF